MPSTVLRRSLLADGAARVGIGPGYGAVVGAWEQGRSTVEYLMSNGRLEQVAAEGANDAADGVLDRAERRLTTASAGLGGGDVEGAFVAAYDAYRMAAESLLVRQGLRAIGGAGSHVTVEDAVSAQFASAVKAFAKPTFERFRRMRHSAQYYDSDGPAITHNDAAWAILTAQSAAEGTRRISEGGGLSRFEPS